MNNEQLVKMAETIGWTEVWIENNSVFGHLPDTQIPDEFDPANIPAQREEIEEWLMKEGFEIGVAYKNTYYSYEVLDLTEIDMYRGEGSTRAEALLNTFWEVIK